MRADFILLVHNLINWNINWTFRCKIGIIDGESAVISIS
jgi:hypothetical protein